MTSHPASAWLARPFLSLYFRAAPGTSAGTMFFVRGPVLGNVVGVLLEPSVHLAALAQVDVDYRAESTVLVSRSRSAPARLLANYLSRSYVLPHTWSRTSVPGLFLSRQQSTSGSCTSAPLPQGAAAV